MAIIRLGVMVERDGLLLHALLGEAIHGIGNAALARDRQQLTPSKAAETTRVMETIAASRDPPESVLERGRLWDDLAMTWRHRLEVVFNEIFGQESTEAPTARAFLEVRDRGRSQAELLMVDLALRAYHADHGAWPASLNELSPQYLQRVPLDRYSGRPLIYRPEGTTFSLYSVGKDGRDDGGKFGNNQTYFATQGHDYDLDTMIRP